MTRPQKLERYKQHMKARGVSGSTAFPPAWRLLWRLGLELAPPPFLSFASLALFTGVPFGLLFALGVWLLESIGLRDMSVGEPLWAALITGPLFGLFMAAYYRRLARKHSLGPWVEFTGVHERNQ